MVIWRITGNEIGPDGNAAAHFATRAAADKALREHKEWRRDKGASIEGVAGPEKLVISNREQLAHALDDAMGYGAS